MDSKAPGSAGENPDLRGNLWKWYVNPIRITFPGKMMFRDLPGTANDELCWFPEIEIG
jgi:hypothetical protein